MSQAARTSADTPELQGRRGAHGLVRLRHAAWSCVSHADRAHWQREAEKAERARTAERQQDALHLHARMILERARAAVEAADGRS